MNSLEWKFVPLTFYRGIFIIASQTLNLEHSLKSFKTVSGTECPDRLSAYLDRSLRASKNELAKLVSGHPSSMSEHPLQMTFHRSLIKCFDWWVFVVRLSWNFVVWLLARWVSQLTNNWSYDAPSQPCPSETRPSKKNSSRRNEKTVVEYFIKDYEIKR